MKTNICISLVVVLYLFSASSCKKTEDDPPAPAVIQSTHGSTASHNMGEPCLSCHASGGSAASEGIWAIAGTVYIKDGSVVSPNGTIYLWSGFSGTGNLLATLQVDGNGNFYTTSPILPGTGAYMQVKGASGDIQNMPAMNFSGNCNGCHGISNARIWVN
jgi:hypothetical protein